MPGYAKTRLIPALGADGAAALQAAMIRRAVRQPVPPAGADHAVVHPIRHMRCSPR